MGYQQFDNLLHKVSKIEGKLLGPSCDVYRVPTTSWLDWKIAANKQSSINASFAIGGTYKKNPNWKVPLARVGVDGRTLLPGDILEDTTNNRTYFLIEREPNRPFEAIQAQQTITISNTSGTDYGDTGDGWGVQVDADVQDVARNIPACVIVPSSTSIDGGFVPARSSYEASTNRYELYFWLPEGLVNNGSVITFGDVKISVQQAFFSPAGYKVSGVEVDDS